MSERAFLDWTGFPPRSAERAPQTTFFGQQRHFCRRLGNIVNQEAPGITFDALARALHTACSANMAGEGAVKWPDH